MADRISSQVTSSDDTDITHSKAGSLSLCQNSRCTDMPLKPQLCMPSVEEGKAPLPPSRRSSVMSILNASFSSRRNSLATGGRRLSFGSWMHCGRVSFSGLPIFEPVRETFYENTYKTHPDEGCKFNSSRVKQVLELVLTSYLSGAKYDPANGGPTAQNLSDIIRNRVKDITSPRYKLVCNVYLGQKANQGLCIASRSLWDEETDNFACATFVNSSLFVLATVHGLYFE